MLVKPTNKWINSIAVPNCGIIRKPFNSEFADVSEDVGQWLIEAGFAVREEDRAIEPIESRPIELSSVLPIEEPLPLLEKPAEQIKTKKSSKLFVNPEN